MSAHERGLTSGERSRPCESSLVYCNLDQRVYIDIDRQRCLSAGCDDFISKPFAISELERRLTNLVSAETTKTRSAKAYKTDI